LPSFRLEHVLEAGKTGRMWELKGRQMTIGQSAGDITFPGDARMARLHARLTVEPGQLHVEDLSNNGVFVRLVGTYMLQEGDGVLIGTQMLRFHENSEALSAAAFTGTAIRNVANLLHAPVAEFVAIGQDGEEAGRRYPLHQEEVTFGRSGATYSFPDDAFLSRVHARVYHRGENFFIEDNSRNGTYLKVRGKAPVPAGSTLIIGSQLFRVGQEK
jgi:pSer/pThr/pTyr-binding forkhead associated (FHA) protein